MFKKLLIAFCFFCVAMSSFAVPEEQLGSYARTWESNGIRYGLPGLANIKVQNKDSIKFYEDVLPRDEDEKLVIDLEHSVKYAGSVYKQLTLASNGRIFLGGYKDYVLPKDGDDGLYPYVKAITNEFTPIVGEKRISVSWRKFKEHNDEFTVVEIGPYLINGLSESFLCQVSFYNDGEIQVQYWNMSRSGVAAMASPFKLSTLSEYGTMTMPYVYTGSSRMTLGDKSDFTVFATNPISIYEKPDKYAQARGVTTYLREGWIAKSFVDDGPTFSETYNDEDKQVLDVYFGEFENSGGLLAYDYARENPVVGSFQSMSMKISSYENENEVCSSTKCIDGYVPLYFWYFNENEMYPNRADLAGYPYLTNGTSLHMDSKSLNAGYDKGCVEKNGSVTTVYPCAYGYSWKKHKGIVYTVIAPAIKMQVNGNARQKNLYIEYLRLRPLQPRSIQFRPPQAKKVEYEGRGGYLEVGGGKKAPVSMAVNANVHGIIHVTPGFKISEIKINDKVAFDVSKTTTLAGVNVENFPSQNLAYIDFKLINDVRIAVTYTLCSEREVAKYDPDLANIVPSYKKEVLFIDSKSPTNVMETYSVSDGFGQIVQTQVSVAPGHFLVTAEYKDEMGVTSYAPLPYIVDKPTYSFEEMFCQQCVRNSASYYNGRTDLSKERAESYGFPYIETNHHYGENKAIVATSAGVGEASFELGKNLEKTWKIPVKTDNSSEFFSFDQLMGDNEPNAVGSSLDNEYLNKIAGIKDEDLSEISAATYPYELTVNLSFDGIYSQVISDVAGNVMATWMMQGAEPLITRNKYHGYDDDITSKTSLIKESYIENHELFKTTYEYDDIGRMIASTQPDRGRVEVKYDSKNRTRFTRDQKQKNKGDDFFNILEYDEEDRVVMEGTVRGDCKGCSFDNPDESISNIYPIHETVYGIPDPEILQDKAAEIDVKILKNVIPQIEGVTTYDKGASISYNDDKHVNDIKMFSYDRLGRVKKSWVLNNVEKKAPAIEVSYSYNSAGLVEYSTIRHWNYSNSEWAFVTKRRQQYDNMGRLEKIYEVDAENNEMLLASYEYNSSGVAVKSSFYDKGSPLNASESIVYSMDLEKDIYGRTNKISYNDASGNVLYEEQIEYNEPLVGRMSKATHVWNGISSKKKVEVDEYVYDESGRLASFVNKGSYDKSGEYSYDGLGRLIKKTEGDSTLEYQYQEGSYQPKSISLNGQVIDKALQYDATGKVWLDGFNKIAYKLNSIGLPERVARYGSIPATLDHASAEKGVVFNEEFANIEMAYDESGTRIWEHERGRDYRDWSKVTVPGIGVYKREKQTAFAIERLDLINGGFRVGGTNGVALFPMSDVQGNIRGYASESGVKSIFTYYPFGQVTEVETETNTKEVDSRRWQGKEYDEEQGKYYFGARYFDSFFGLWMSPDPAGQFANPYTYGGDPVNFIDPTGMFSFGVGLVVGWDENHGWNWGFGSSFDLSYKGTNYSGVGSFNLSYTWSQDGSSTFDIGASGSWQWYIFNFNAGLSYSYNSYTGSVLSTQGGVCIGNAQIACAGIENGYSAYWDSYGNFVGATTFVELYAQVAGGIGRASAGYEWGLLGMEGRDFYVGANVAGIHGELSHIGGGDGKKMDASWGFEEKFYYKLKNEGKDPLTGKSRKYVGWQLGPFDIWYDHGNRNDNQPSFMNRDEFEEYANDSKNNMKFGEYPKSQSKYHHGTKMWMAKTAPLHFLWFDLLFTIPAIEAVFDKNGNSVPGDASYNYGQNWISHVLLDILPWKVMDVWFPNP